MTAGAVMVVQRTVRAPGSALRSGPVRRVSLMPGQPRYPLRIIGHLVPEDGWLLACGTAAAGGFPAAGGGTSSAAAGWM